MKVVVLGGGESGIGAAVLAKKKNFQVFVSDFGKIQPKYRKVLEEKAIPYEENQHTRAIILEATEVIKSPGIPDKATIIKEIQAAKIPIIGEIEFAYRFLPSDAFVIAITGSNGKTTTTLLTYHLLLSSGITAHLAGNVGPSFANLVAEEKNGVFVLELSSFQLDNIETFKPDIAALLNISPDHLDRYDHNLENYIRSKMRIFKNQSASDILLYNSTDKHIADYLNRCAPESQLWPLSNLLAQKSQISIGKKSFDLTRTTLRGKHNQMNALFALTITSHFDIEVGQIQTGLESFSNAPHRLESIGVVEGVEFINDSKATNVDAVFFALDALDQPIVWIVGGQDKGNDYSMLDPLVESKVKAIIGLGLDNHKIVDHFSGICSRIIDTNNMISAVNEALKQANSGDVILLSPACASFDLFKNYEDRGNQFKAIIHSMIKAD